MDTITNWRSGAAGFRRTSANSFLTGPADSTKSGGIVRELLATQRYPRGRQDMEVSAVRSSGEVELPEMVPNRQGMAPATPIRFTRSHANTRSDAEGASGDARREALLVVQASRLLSRIRQARGQLHNHDFERAFSRAIHHARHALRIVIAHSNSARGQRPPC
jgi:hypothetical protein